MKAIKFTDTAGRERRRPFKLVDFPVETLRQIFISVSDSEYSSWGTDQLAPGLYKGMPTLALRVNGTVHKGWVYVSLNESGFYEVRLVSTELALVAPACECRCDNIGAVIDQLVMRPTSLSNNELRRLSAVHRRAD